MSEREPQTGARILLVDDEAPILRTFRYCLEDEGYRVTTAQTGAQALAALEREVFDVCFLDVSIGEDLGEEGRDRIGVHMQIPLGRLGPLCPSRCFVQPAPRATR